MLRMACTVYLWDMCNTGRAVGENFGSAYSSRLMPINLASATQATGGAFSGKDTLYEGVLSAAPAITDLHYAYLVSSCPPT